MLARPMSLLSDPATYVAFATLLALEVVLGIDNVIFISILAGRLPEAEQKKARTTGLALAVVTRLGLLSSLAFLAKLTTVLFTFVGHEVTGRDLILVFGGVFLIGKSTHEIHQKLEGAEDGGGSGRRATFASVVAQILILDMVFSLDSVITAIGMVDKLPIMIAAVIVATGIMIAAAGTISAFVDRHPSVKILALSFLLLVGFTLIVEGLDHHLSKGYVYFAMAFSVFVEMINIRFRKKEAQRVKLHSPYSSPGSAPPPPP
jgi:predicted tellurium resistance membrane protein TerC